MTATGLADVRFGTTATGAEQTGDGVRLRAEDAAGRATVSHHPYVLAADGSRSRLRELAGLPGTAEEYPDYALRVVTDSPLDALLPGLAPLTYVRDPGARTAPSGCPTTGGSSSGSGAGRPATRSSRRKPSGPGSPGAARRRRRAVRVTDAHTYRLARFLLPTYRAGRVLFAGDAAHLTSTAGGLNMNCGLHDAVETGRALATVLRTGTGDEAPLDEALARRRSVVETAVLPRSEARTAGLDSPAELPARIADLRRTAADPVRPPTTCSRPHFSTSHHDP
ncbi:FAD-dependent monooxygenase [Streptomyces diastatochromogenes]|nr:FAD-dependent monooxygenase [Streptomyces diastatochromogenes]